MLRNTAIVAALLIPGLAHAEFKKPAAPAETRPTAKVASQPLTIAGMLDKINGVYMLGMQRCYEKALSKNPQLAGKITVVFTVNQWGHVTGTASGIAPTVDSCLSTQVGIWRFPSPRNTKGALTEASFKINLLLHQ